VSATIAIPDRWQPAAFQIKHFIEEYAASHGRSVGEVSLAFQLDAGQVYLLNHSLGESDLLACVTAMQALSTRLNANLSKDPWQACRDVIEELERERKIISGLMGASSSRGPSNQDKPPAPSV
jgi:hypothetical protein